MMQCANDICLNGKIGLPYGFLWLGKTCANFDKMAKYVYPDAKHWKEHMHSHTAENALHVFFFFYWFYLFNWFSSNSSASTRKCVFKFTCLPKIFVNYLIATLLEPVDRRKSMGKIVIKFTVTDFESYWISSYNLIYKNKIPFDQITCVPNYLFLSSEIVLSILFDNTRLCHFDSWKHTLLWIQIVSRCLAMLAY